MNNHRCSGFHFTCNQLVIHKQLGSKNNLLTSSSSAREGTFQMGHVLSPVKILQQKEGCNRTPLGTTNSRKNITIIILIPKSPVYN